MNIIKSFKSWYAAYGSGGLLAALMGMGLLFIIGAGVFVGVTTGSPEQAVSVIGMLCSFVVTNAVKGFIFILLGMFIVMSIFSFVRVPRMEETDE